MSALLAIVRSLFCRHFYQFEAFLPPIGDAQVIKKRCLRCDTTTVVYDEDA